MLNKPTIAVLVLVIVVVIGAGIYAGSTQTQTNSSQSNNNTTDDISQVNTSQNDSVDSGEKMISAAEAQEIAKRYIEEPNATAGTPRLSEEDGTKTYIVPVIMNGSTVGQIEINAYTGKNVGGAGGAP